MIQIQVKDTGIGIPEDEFEAIFEHFSRLTPSYTGIYKGMGLGLYTVKRYVEALNGSIYVNSVVGQGSCFTINLPLIVSDRSDRIKPPSRLSNQVKTTIDMPMHLETPGSIPEELDTASILVVEDNPLAAMAVKILLDPLNCYTEVAENGTQAVNMALDGDYDLILMDIGLPDFSGIEATKKIRAFTDQKKSQVPIVAVTGHANEPTMRQEALDAGMQEVLSKPAEVDTLSAVLDSYVFKSSDTQ